ncbi:primosomal protein N' [Gilvimarinus sp. SDUM040013]|uniref:Replication restart protein PriA n=1 Tax=Gilvimarinus gilvus TaxID=3058038 RepID=A0ABU4RY87_9GAMM|nr:primosomal protein N' [Gilvimarinus sp. SDUM040013]MDO3387393.1 primosomal protein N' [Gilvimarinus sp. SDUM040013]MDX6849870.1 primosomal protein N' [Gilvimarinus sp. SDUM040013]
MTPLNLVQIALPVPLRRVFDYLWPADSPHCPAGSRVEVPFGNRTLIGIVVSFSDQSDTPREKLKPIKQVIDRTPVLNDELLGLIIWAANYYQSPIGEALQTALPVLLRQGAPLQAQTSTSEQWWQLTTEGLGLPDNALRKAPQQALLLAHLRANKCCPWSKLKEAGYARDTLLRLRGKGLAVEAQEPPPAPTERPLVLNSEQQAALDAISYKHYQTYLLNGATGSGKTEVYLQAIAQLQQQRAGAQTLVLVPEIGLTPQTIGRFKKRFGGTLAVLHSGLNDRERLNSWVRAATGEAQIIVGTRSALFTPMITPGLIIIDEEHDTSFKQQDGFRYSARDLACVRAKSLNIPLILGSATPALESLHNAKMGRFQTLPLQQRANRQAAPLIEVIDTVEHNQGLAIPSLQAIKRHLHQGNQVLVFLNRRGYAPTLKCRDCGTVVCCPNCDARLTLHHTPKHLHCHHCDFQRGVLRSCESCHGRNLEPIGQGTERSEEALAKRFAEFPVWRIDRDSTRNKGALESLFNRINSGEPCILVGTQMLAKGHHFPKVTLAVILDVDGGLLSADFRGPERLGQLITQVAGRSGRGERRGEVILQSQNRDHPLLQQLIHQGYGAFADALLSEREITQMPPYAPIALIRADALNADSPRHFLTELKHQLSALAEQHQVQMLGPMPALMEKKGQRYRHQLQLKAHTRHALQTFLATLSMRLEANKAPRDLRWSIDVDPQDMG